MNILIGFGIWLVIALLAMVNGAVREKFLAKWLGKKWALPLSGVTLSLIVFLVTLNMLHYVSFATPVGFIGLGFFWLAITLVFEYSMGLIVEKKTLREISQVFNVKKGDLFILVLLTAAFSPLLVAWLNGFF